MSTYNDDANGNRTSANGSTYTTGAGNELLFDGTYTYTYDAEGNRTARFIDANHDGVLDAGDTGVTTYAWDARERLTEVRDYATFASFSSNSPTQVVDYLYDVENRWIGENIDSNGDGQIDHEIRFAYDGDQIVLQFDRDLPSTAGGGAGGEGGVLTASDLSHRYTWQPGAVDQLMSDEQLSPLPPGEGQGEGYDLTQPGKVVLALTDNLGTVRDLAVFNSTTGVTSVANHLVYDTFGNLQSQTNAAVDCLFGFTGRATDNNTGLRNHLNRWTDPRTADWMSEDPSGLSADVNPRRYCGNSPTNATDPTGLAWVDDKTATAVVTFLNRLVEVPTLLTGNALQSVVNLAIAGKILADPTIANGQPHDILVTIPLGAIAKVPVATTVTLKNVVITSNRDDKTGVTTYNVAWDLKTTVEMGTLKAEDLKALGDELQSVAKALVDKGAVFLGGALNVVENVASWAGSRIKDLLTAPLGSGKRLQNAEEDLRNLYRGAMGTLDGVGKGIFGIPSKIKGLLSGQSGIRSSGTGTGGVTITAKLGDIAIATLTVPYNGQKTSPTWKMVDTNEVADKLKEWLSGATDLLDSTKRDALIKQLLDKLSTDLLKGNFQTAFTNFVDSLKNIVNLKVSLPFTVVYDFDIHYKGTLVSVPTPSGN